MYVSVYCAVIYVDIHGHVHARVYGCVKMSIITCPCIFNCPNIHAHVLNWRNGHNRTRAWTRPCPSNPSFFWYTRACLIIHARVSLHFYINRRFLFKFSLRALSLSFFLSADIPISGLSFLFLAIFSPLLFGFFLSTTEPFHFRRLFSPKCLNLAPNAPKPAPNTTSPLLAGERHR